MPLPFHADGGPVTGTAGKRQDPGITPGTAKNGAQMVKKSRKSRGFGRFNAVPEGKDRKIPAGGKKRAVPLSALLPLVYAHLFPADPVVLVLPLLPGSCDPSPHNTCSSALRSHFRFIEKMESGKREDPDRTSEETDPCLIWGPCPSASPGSESGQIHFLHSCPILLCDSQAVPQKFFHASVFLFCFSVE